MAKDNGLDEDIRDWPLCWLFVTSVSFKVISSGVISIL